MCGAISQRSGVAHIRAGSQTLRCGLLGLCVVCLVIVATTLKAFASHAESTEEIILVPGEPAIRTGSTSQFAAFQFELHRQLRICQRERGMQIPKMGQPGLFGPRTMQAIGAYQQCKGMDSAPASRPVHTGALTQSVWRSVMGNAPEPDLQERVDAFVLSFEATDFSDKPEWNFCQDSSEGEREQARSGHGPVRCYNATDPCSMLTWGPRGATAGQGREIQAILWALWRRQPDLLERAFGPESPNMLRFMRLQGPPYDEDCNGSSPLEHFMCAVWTDQSRRALWDAGLVKLAELPATRQAYRQVYARDEYDGYKLRAYYTLWHQLGLSVSEIDYAFFYDRATHIGTVPEKLDLKMLRSCVVREGETRNPHAASRRCQSLLHPHDMQAVDRLARDVAFYIGAYSEDGLSEHEVTTWRYRIPLIAEHHFGLSDQRLVPIDMLRPKASSEGDMPAQDATELTAREMACPVEIRAPMRFLPHARVAAPR